ncbi:DUF1800 domain-containing protein [Ohtaekwangia koreensis]|uniref:Uncharacterized conserved protein, DUF1800 family n=1 Tax=Ohtaekwangia koreensis TaxID=688867 RepID=A0A1T5MIT5_9BACT|nr:DUF1800 domain-containing protein [Ohtaekwangia koreensis]SKC87838.1 Uncharacterized conserved protein, DUF1800 family [Ohtaekwangia koreensis]
MIDTKHRWLFLLVTIIVLLNGIMLSASISQSQADPPPSYRFPYAQAGLTREQAAAHLVSRFTYGVVPGQIEDIVNMGLENWFQQQLTANLKDDKVNALLDDYDALKLSNADIVNTYFKNAQILRMAIADGVIDRDSAKLNKGEYRDQLKDYAKKKQIKPERELIRQFSSQKIIRAVYTNNQLQEVLAEFWFNHFNISFTKKICAQFIPGYERDAIRPHALGAFEDLLVSTAKSPAMLLYLDNFSSVGTKDTIAEKKQEKKGRMKGLNENYAREVMELHTLGVDGGYTQNDVTEAARILTGWTLYPIGKENFGNSYKKLLEREGEDKLKARGFIHDGDFLFTPNRHDTGKKIVMGKSFPPGKGYEEGLQLLTFLAHHPATAKFISTKIATRFVSDEPPVRLIEKMAKTFLERNGDIKQVLITMVSSTEFWEPSAIRAKTKSPLEVAVSSLRALNAEVYKPYEIYTWITRMGQPLYFYQAPTGFPDRGQYWINTGSLLNRMNFGLALADGRIPGVKFNLLALNKNHEPESAEDALITYSKLLLPERNVEETVKRLTPLLNAQNLDQKINEAAGSAASDSTMRMATTDSLSGEALMLMNPLTQTTGQSKYRLSQVIGILLGSPEFQRR